MNSDGFGISSVLHGGDGTVFRSRLPLVLAHIETHLADELSLDKLAVMTGMSEFRRRQAA